MSPRLKNCHSLPILRTLQFDRRPSNGLGWHFDVVVMLSTLSSSQLEKTILDLPKIHFPTSAFFTPREHRI